MACVNAIEDLFEYDTKRHAYTRDCELAPNESTCCLSNIESYISINPDRNVEEMPGINTSMHYIGEKDSYTALHEEDGGLSSLNLLKYGHPKLWLIIDYRWRAEVENNVVNYLKEKFPKKKFCDQMLEHKIYLLSPQFLNELGIPYSIVLQKSGDLFFIRAGTYHCVINMGNNVAKAVNITEDAISAEANRRCYLGRGSQNMLSRPRLTEHAISAEAQRKMLSRPALTEDAISAKTSWKIQCYSVKIARSLSLGRGSQKMLSRPKLAGKCYVSRPK